MKPLSKSVGAWFGQWFGQRWRALGRQGRLRPLLEREVVFPLLLSVLLFVLGTQFVAQGYQVEGQCMEPWLYEGERIWGDKWTLRWRAPRRGDVIIFSHPSAPSQLYIKRVVALGGETVVVRDGVVYIDERPLEEPYRAPSLEENYGPHWVAAGSYFVLGDNRDQSNDSRHWGDVAAPAVVAKAWLRYWPPRRWAAPF